MNLKKMCLKQEIKETVEGLFDRPKAILNDDGMYKVLDFSPRVKGNEDWDGRIEPPHNYENIKQGQSWYFCEKMNGRSFWALASDNKEYEYLYGKNQPSIQSALSHIDWAITMKTTRDVLDICTTNDD